MKIARRRKQDINLDMSPLIDCIFQLLIFFMLSSVFLQPSIRITLPQAVVKDGTQDLEIVVTVSQSGEFYLNGEPVEVESLQARLKELIDRSEHKVVTFNGDEKMHYQCFVRALDAARAGGAIHFDIVHQDGGGG